MPPTLKMEPKIATGGKGKKWVNPFRKGSTQKGASSPSTSNDGLKSATYRDESFTSATDVESLGDFSTSFGATVANNGNNQNETNDSADMYGYGDATPDSHCNQEDASKYGYGDSSPSSSGRRKRSNHHHYKHSALSRRRNSLGEPSNDDKAKYGYGDEATSGPPLKSAMKRNRRRRASIQFGGEIEVSLPGKSEPVRRRRSITFNDNQDVKEVAPVSALADNPTELWFQQEEYKRMRNKSLEIVSKVEQGKTGNRKFCVRGLEALMSEGSEYRQARRFEAWDSVLDEQSLQRQEGTFNEAEISAIYEPSTLESRVEALRRAEKDAAEIQNYMSGARRRYRRMSM